MKTLSAYELDDLCAAVSERLNDALLPALTKANRTGELGQLLALLGMRDLVSESSDLAFEPVRVMVLGDSTIKEGQLRSLIRKRGLDPANFEFVLGYDELKHANFAKLRNSFTYRAIMVGPMPHSTPGKGNSSSFMTEVENHPENYPPLIRLQDSTGLRITNNSFKRALDELMLVR